MMHGHRGALPGSDLWQRLEVGQQDIRRGMTTEGQAAVPADPGTVSKQTVFSSTILAGEPRKSGREDRRLDPATSLHENQGWGLVT